MRRQIKQITQDLEYEKDYNVQLFVDEQVTQMCQKAYFSFNLMTKENQLKQYAKQEGENIRREAATDKEASNQLAGSAISVKLATPLRISAGSPKQHAESASTLHKAGTAEVLDASVRMGQEDRRQSASLLTHAESQEAE